MTCRIANPNSLDGKAPHKDHDWEPTKVRGWDRERCRRCAKLNPLGVPPPVRFWDHVDTDPHGCWMWKGDKINSGYGRYTVVANGKSSKTLAHRYAWTLMRGEIPARMELDHLCKVLLCVRPSHLDLVSHKENLRRAIGHTWGVCKLGHRLVEGNLRKFPGSRARCLTCWNARLAAEKAERRIRGLKKPGRKRVPVTSDRGAAQ